jgi:hypothetical protein
MSSVTRRAAAHEAPEDVLAELLLDRTRGPLTPEWEVVRAHAQGRVLHFNGASCYILNTDGSLTLTETGQANKTTMRVFSRDDEWAKGYIKANATRPASVLDALRLAEMFDLFSLGEFYRDPVAPTAELEAL